MQHQEFLDRIRRRAATTSDGEARTAAEATLAALANVLGEDGRRRLTAAVPGPLQDAAGTVGPGRAELSDFLAEVGRRAGGVNEERARRLAQSVLSTLAEHAPELAGELELPGELATLWSEPGPGGGVVSNTGHEPPLTDDEVRAALAARPQWSGDAHRISRTIALPEENQRAVLDQVRDLAEREGRHVSVDHEPDGVRLTVWTRSVDAVTRTDVDFAGHIDGLLDEVSPLV